MTLWVVDDDLERIFEEAGIDYFEHYSYEEEATLEPYDGIEDFEDHLSPATVTCLWAIVAMIIGVVLLLT